ncbi:response regulator transcription factor [Microbacterium sp. M3]|uniref:Response regulator transcription factor n=1 Tax=Microbacterium arthrosphaerae TaxID=792652 RepID=A0ABU4H4R0_9MICO|nr:MULTISPECIES: response regulator transcription factor [Microbacterium]MDW4574308.1 response regulator transcription factor [Microbacterium arthrosphaerae]MDW7608163.1 response regulator transcription factor [Microbacterium sp. M3]
MSPVDDQHPVRVLVVDDDFLVRAAVTGILSPHPAIDVVGTAASGMEALELARATRTDVVLMDIQMPGMDGVEATRALLAAVDTQVVAMTSLASAEMVQRMLDAGAYGYILKDAAPDALAEAVLTVARGDAFLSPRHTRALLERLASEADREARRGAAAQFANLTDREREAARLVAAGATDGEIAQTMHVALSTAKAHIQQARLKLGARNRTQVGVIVERAGETPTG